MLSYTQKRVMAAFLGGALWLGWYSSHNASPEQGTQTQKQYGAAFNAQQENPERAIARYNRWLMYFTGILASATIGLGSATVGLYFAGRSQTRLARDEFEATHRARVRVRRVNLHGSRNDFGGVNFRLANAGDCDAIIRIIGCGLARKANGAWLGDQPPDPRTGTMTPQDQSLPMGPARQFLFIMAVDNDARMAVREQQHDLFVIGEIEYTDKSNIIRNTGFCWVYDHGIRDFRKSKEDEEYNYED
jgi:hypothetical protein